MKVKYTHIVGVESNESNVKIKFRPMGSDSSDEPLSVSITPHETYLYLNLNYAEFENGGNTVQLKIRECRLKSN